MTNPIEIKNIINSISRIRSTEKKKDSINSEKEKSAKKNYNKTSLNSMHTYKPRNKQENQLKKFFIPKQNSNEEDNLFIQEILMTQKKLKLTDKAKIKINKLIKGESITGIAIAVTGIGIALIITGIFIPVTFSLGQALFLSGLVALISIRRERKQRSKVERRSIENTKSQVESMYEEDDDEQL